MSVWEDVRLSTRSLTRTPGQTFILLLTIALGVGSNAAVVGFLRGSLSRDLPLPEVDRMVSVFGRDRSDAFGPVSYDAYLQIRAARDSLELLSAVRESRSTVGVGDRSSVMAVAEITPDGAPLFQLPTNDGVVISHAVWQSEFGGKREIAGEQIHLEGVAYSIGGVAPEWLHGVFLGSPVDIWAPLRDATIEEIDRSSRSFWLVGRLQRGVTTDRAQAVLSASRNADQVAVVGYTGMTPETAGGLARLGSLLAAAVAAVFLIACCNVLAFLLSRASARSHETAVRVALGASRRQLARHMIADSALISGAGGVFGLLLGGWTAQALPAFLFESDAETLAFVPSLFGIAMSTAVCVGITVACGLIPLVDTRHDDPARVLRRESAGPSRGVKRLRGGLVVAQMACCCVLVISAALVLSAFRTALQTSAGARLTHSVLATLESVHRFANPELGLEYFREAVAAAGSVPGVTAIAVSAVPPGTRPGWKSWRVEPPHLPTQEVVMNVALFTPQSLQSVTLPPLAGRMFGGADRPNSCKVVVLNEQAAQELFAGDAVGRTIEDAAGQRLEIVGVVAARRDDANVATDPTVYYHLAQGAMPLEHKGPARFRVPILPHQRAILETHVVSPDYFGMMGLAVVEGALFEQRAPSTACRVGVVNQPAAERYFAGNAVSGALIDAAGRRTEIVGVVPAPVLRATQRPAEPGIYFPLAQDYLSRVTLVALTAGADENLMDLMRQRLAAVRGGARLPVVTTLEAHLTRTALASERVAVVLVGASAITALVLGVLGLYGAMTDATLHRRRELAVRVALGAQGWRVVGQVIAEGLRLAAVGAVAGTLGSVLIARWLARVTPNAEAAPLWVWVAAPVALAGAVAIAGLLPGRRALAVDPLTITRDE